MAAFLVPDSAVRMAIYRASSVSHSRTSRAAFSGSACVCFAMRRVSAGSRRGTAASSVLLEIGLQLSLDVGHRARFLRRRGDGALTLDDGRRRASGAPSAGSHRTRRAAQSAGPPRCGRHRASAARSGATSGSLRRAPRRRLLERDVLDRQPIASLLVEADRRGDDVVNLLDLLRRPRLALALVRRSDRRRAARPPTAWRSGLAAESDGVVTFPTS